MKPLDVQFMKAIHNKVNVVPVIAKADTLTLRERDRLKRRVMHFDFFPNTDPYCFIIFGLIFVCGHCCRFWMKSMSMALRSIIYLMQSQMRMKISKSKPKFLRSAWCSFAIFTVKQND